MQMEALECGAACLTMILASWGKWVPLERVRTACGVSRDGSKASNVVRAARTYGLEAKGFRWEPEEFFKSASFPCIVHWDFNHFVVVRGVRGGKVYLADPAKGLTTVTLEQFDESFTGIAMLFAPGDDFVADGKRKSVGSFVRRRLIGTASITAFAVICSLISALLAMTTPAFSKTFLNRVLGTAPASPDLLPHLLFAMLFIAVFSFAFSVIRVSQGIRVGNELDAVSSTSFIWHVLHLPMEFFSQRQPADIGQRMGLNAGVAESLINTLAPLLLSALTAVVYLVMMISYSPLLAVIGVSGVLLNVLLARFATNKRIDLTKGLLRDLAMVQGSTATGMQMIETVKAAGAEEGFFARWAGLQANASNARTRILREMLLVSTLPSLVSSMINIFIMVVGVMLVRRGYFLIGTVFAFQSVLSQFAGPSNELINAGQTIAEMRTNMERIDDVMDYPEQATFAPDDADISDTEDKLEGNIVFRDVSFGYSRLERPLIEHFDLELHPGEQVAVVGPSGCGKSTVAKLAMGLFEPWSGEILYDGKPLSQIRSDVFFSSAAMVDQEVVLFADTIANNIRMWDTTISDESVYHAAQDAQIHNQIMERPGAYNCKLSENGSDLSGGERQRLEIARALAQDPSIIVLDEATSALDGKTESMVVQALRERGAATLVIAHRLATIRHADRIVVLEHGHIVEQGTHEELMAQDGVYATLVRDE